MQAFEVIQRLAATTSKTEKTQIVLDAYMSGNRDFFLGAKLAYDRLVTFGVKKVPTIDESDLNPDNPGTLTFADFIALCNRLARRDLTGNAAAEAIRDAASRCHGPTWNDFYRRVLRKDFACGVTESTINTALKRMRGDDEAAKLIIPVFEPQLAHDGNKPPHTKKLKGRKLLDVKLDGVRLLTALDKDAGTVTQFTRDGIIKETFPHITDSLAPLLPELPFSVMLDGEVTAKSFQDLMTEIGRKGKVDGSNAKLALFDMVPLTDFHAEFCPMPQIERHEWLCALEVSGLLRRATGGAVYVIPKIEVDLDTEEGQDRFAAFNREALEAKYEGIMIKDPAAPYKCGRNAHWLKKKPVISLSMTVIGFDPGKIEGKRRDVMGNMNCEVWEDGKHIVSGCGTGFSDEQLEEFWRNRDTYVGMIAEIEADAVTLERGTDVYSLRFPRFKGFRGHKPGEKI